jgi:hypothetical protein
MVDVAFLARMGAGGASPLAAVLRDESLPFQMALRSLIRRSDDPAVRGHAWAWLGHGLAPSAVVERLGRAGSAQEHEVVLRRIHLIENPRRAAGARRIKAGPGAGFVPGGEMLAHLSSAARRGLPRWLAAVEVPVEQRRGAMAGLLADADPGVRLAALRHAWPAALAAACGDPDARVAAGAMRRCSTAGVERRRAAARSDRSAVPIERREGHAAPAVRVLAEQERARLDPWDARSAAGRLAARTRLAASPGVFCGEVRDRLGSGDGALGAVQLVRALGLCARFEADLLSRLGSARPHEADDRLTPTLLAALGELPTEGARLAVDAHVRDARPRLRANAVEALARQTRGAEPGSRRADVLVELKDDPHHRVRANAIRGLFQRGRLFGEPGSAIEEPVAFESLGAMLSDERPGHRLAAVWLAGRVLAPVSAVGRRWAELAGRVNDLARSDPDPAARARAARAASRLVVGLREGWRRQAADVGLGATVTKERAA